MDFLEKNRLYIVGLVFFLITIPLSFIINIWIDEAYTLQTTSGGVMYAFKQAIFVELQAPLYFVFLAIWRIVDSSIFWARMFSVFSIFVSIILFDQLLKGITKKTFLFLLLFSIHPITLWAALEIRTYPFTILTVVAYLFFFKKYYQSNPTNLKNRAIHIGLIILGLLNYYYFGFFIAGVFLYLMISDRKLLKYFVIDMVFPSLICLPLIGLVYFQITEYSFVEMPNYFSLLNLLKFLMINFFDPFFIPVFSWSSNAYANIGFRLIFISLFISIVFSNKKIIHQLHTNIYFVVTLVLIICFFIIYFVLGAIYAIHPHPVFIQIPLFLTFFSILADAKSKPSMKAIILFLFITSSISLVIKFNNPYKFLNYKAIAKEIDKIPEEQPVFIYTNLSHEVLKHYVAKERKMIALPEEVKYDSFKYWIISETGPLDSIIFNELKGRGNKSFVFISDVKSIPYKIQTDHHQIVIDYFLDNYFLVDSLNVQGFTMFVFKEPPKQNPAESK